MHISDWLPTILRIAGQEQPEFDIDGVDQFESIFQDDTEITPRTMVVNELSTDLRGGFRGAFQNEDGFKFLLNPGISPLETYHLYNVNTDPSEANDLQIDYPELFNQMKLRFEVNLSTNEVIAFFEFIFSNNIYFLISKLRKDQFSFSGTP